MCGLTSLQYSEVRWKIALPFEHLKIKNNTKLGVVFGVQKCCKIVCHQGSVTDSAESWGAYSAPPSWIKGGLLLRGGTKEGEEKGEEAFPQTKITTTPLVICLIIHI